MTYRQLAVCIMLPEAKAACLCMRACLLQGLACASDPLLPALQVLDIMKSQGQPPNAITYSCLLLACQHRGDIDEALNLYRQARSSLSFGILANNLS